AGTVCTASSTTIAVDDGERGNMIRKMLRSRILVSGARKARENLLQCHVLGAKKETSASRVRSAGLLLAEHFFVARKNATPRFNSEVRSASGVITWTGLPDSRPSQTFNCSGELVTNLPCFETGIRSSAHL